MSETPSVSHSPSAEQAAEHKSARGLSLGAIVGVAIGGVLACVAGLVLVLFLRCRRHSSDDQRAWRTSAMMIPLDEDICDFRPNFGQMDL
jgi:hypothetical protein